EPAYKQGVTAAANAGRFGKGVAKAGNDKWKANTLAKGPERFSQGVQIAEPAYSAGAQPYTRPSRGPTFPCAARRAPRATTGARRLSARPCTRSSCRARREEGDQADMPSKHFLRSIVSPFQAITASAAQTPIALPVNPLSAILLTIRLTQVTE